MAPGRVGIRWFLGLWLLCAASSAQAADAQEPRCLLINSYHPAYAWTDEQTRGVLDSLARSGVPAAQVAIEYLDAKRLPNLEHGAAFADLLVRKYRTAALACIITTDNSALDYCLANRARLFPGIPIVFCGINGYEPAMIAGQARITGLTETLDIAGTLRLALRLHPQATRLALIYDQTNTGQCLREDFDRAWRELNAPLPLVPLTNLSLAELRSDLGRFGPETVVLLLSFATDRLHQVVEQTEEADLIRAACAAPLYGLHEQRLGHGIIGGMLLSGYHHGRRAGEIAAAILAGADPSAFPVETVGQSQPMFDAVQLAAWGIPHHLLPPDSTVINLPHGIWHDYRSQVLTAGGIALGLVAIIAALVAAMAARRRASTRLAASERFLNETQHIAQVGSYSLDVATGVWESSSTLRAIFGISSDYPHTVDGWLAVVHPDDRQAMRAYFLEEVLGRHCLFDRIYRVRPPTGGGDRWVHGRGQLTLDADGRPERMIGTIQDVTERTLAERAQRASERRFREVLELLPIPIAVADTHGAITLLNQAFVQTFGYTGEDLPDLDSWWPRAYPDADYRARCQTLWQQEIARMLASDGTSTPQEFSVSCRNGAVRQVEIIARLIGDTVVCSLMDITDRKLTQATMREAAAQWQATFDAVHDAIWLLDAAHRVLRSNKAADAFADRPAHEVAGMRCWEVQRGNCSSDCCPVSRARLSLRRETGELRLGERLYEVTADPVLDAAGAYAGCVHLISDVTEVRRLEERLRHTEKLNAIGQLAGGVAHDFNNQLAGIMGFAELLTQRLQDPDQRRQAINILTAARRSADLTGKLLAFARKGQYLKVAVDVHALIIEVLAILARSIDPRIRIEQHLEAGVCRVLGDPSQLQNAFLNLGLNARDAMPTGGLLTFRTAVVPAPADHGELAPGEYLRIEIADTGSGMDETVKAHLFEPFFTTKGPGKGTGMGLPAVYGTVRTHGGAIAVSSAPSTGTTVTIHIPLSATPATTATPITARQTQRRMRRILVVDDEPLVRDLLAAVLSLAGHEVLQAANGREALTVLRAQTDVVDLAILDMVMPEMDGRDTFRALRAIDPSLPVLLASGFSLDGEAQDLLREGVRGFLQKPFQQAELLRRVDDLARS